MQNAGSGSGVTGYVEISSLNGLALTETTLTPLGFGQTDLTFSQITQGNGYWTGLALANPSQTAATATIELDSPAGTTLATTTVTIKAGMQQTSLVSDLFPAIAIPEGSAIHVTASQAIYGLEIFGNSAMGSAFLSFVPSGTY